MVWWSLEVVLCESYYSWQQIFPKCRSLWQCKHAQLYAGCCLQPPICVLAPCPRHDWHKLVRYPGQFPQICYSISVLNNHVTLALTFTQLYRLAVVVASVKSASCNKSSMVPPSISPSIIWSWIATLLCTGIWEKLNSSLMVMGKLSNDLPGCWTHQWKFLCFTDMTVHVMLGSFYNWKFSCEKFCLQLKKLWRKMLILSRDQTCIIALISPSHKHFSVMLCKLCNFKHLNISLLFR